MSLGRRVLKAAAHQVRKGLQDLHHTAAMHLADRQSASFNRNSAWQELDEHMRTGPEPQAPPRAAQAAAPRHPYAREYRLLGAAEGADLESVQQCWRRRVRALHPDQFADSPEKQQSAAAELRQVNAAYQRLKSYLQA